MRLTALLDNIVITQKVVQCARFLGLLSNYCPLTCPSKKSSCLALRNYIGHWVCSRFVHSTRVLSLHIYNELRYIARLMQHGTASGSQSSGTAMNIKLQSILFSISPSNTAQSNTQFTTWKQAKELQCLFTMLLNIQW